MNDKKWEVGGLIAVGAIIVIVILNLIKQEVQKMANEVEKTAINEVLRTVTLINKRFEEIIELQRQQDLAIFYLRGVLDAKDQVLQYRMRKTE